MLCTFLTETKLFLHKSLFSVPHDRKIEHDRTQIEGNGRQCLSFY